MYVCSICLIDSMEFEMRLTQTLPQLRTMLVCWRDLVKLQRMQEGRARLVTWTAWRDYALRQRKMTCVTRKLLHRVQMSSLSRALSSWMTHAARSKRMHRCYSKIAMRWQHMSTSPALSRWIEIFHSSLKRKQASKRIVLRWQNACLHSAVTKWQEYKCEKMLVRRTAEHASISILRATYFELWISNIKHSFFLRRQAVLRSFVNIWLFRTARIRRKTLDATADLFPADSQFRAGTLESFVARSESGSDRMTPTPTHVDVDPRQEEKQGEAEHSFRQTSASPLRSCRSSARVAARNPSTVSHSSRLKVSPRASEGSSEGPKERCTDRPMNRCSSLSRPTSPLTGNRSLINAQVID